MANARLFKAIVICLILTLAVSGFAITKQEKFTRSTDEVWQISGAIHNNGPARDNDEFMTYRYIVSTDGGETWSEAMGTGDHGMYTVTGEGEEADTAGGWPGASYDVGTVVDNNNMIHFIAVLNDYGEDYNPFDRVNGLYDVCGDISGENVDYTLIVAQGDGAFTWANAGKDMDGNLYAVYVNIVTPEEGDAFGELYAVKKTGDAWGEPVMLFGALDPVDNYPSITPTVGDYFWVVYEMPNVDTGRFDHYTIKVSADLSEIGDPLFSGASSNAYYSYYVTAANPIDQDLVDGHVYLTTLHDYNVNTDVVNMPADGNEWTGEILEGPSRYPSIMLYPDPDMGGLPWVFSNVGPPGGGEYHHDWYTYDALGYNGGDWLPQMPIDSTMYDGTRSILYCNQGVVTTDGRIVSGVNNWGQFTPEGFRTTYSDDMGETWSEGQEIWSIFDDGETFVGGYITQNHLLAGPENTVWVAFCGQYGETDFQGPDIEVTGLSSFMLNEPWLVTAEITDNASMVTYADVNWTTGDPNDPEAPWAWLEADSAHADDAGYGTYFFTMPSDTMFGEALADGDEIWFYVFGQDESSNMSGSVMAKLTIGEGWLETSTPAELPASIELGQNYPNPFNNSTVIPFTLDKRAQVNLSVFDINGRKVDTLKNGWLPAGTHQFAWTGDNVSTGVYFYVLETQGQRQMAKMTLLR